jgi:type IV secretion system protein VirB5
MDIRKFFSTGIISTLLLLFVALPARAGIPVIDGANLAQSIQEVLAWGQQAQQMLDQIKKMEQQYQQAQAMTQKLDGARFLGTILNDPNIGLALPPEMRNATQLLLNPAGLSTSQANLSQILSSFGINTTLDQNAGRAQADAIGRAQQILASAQSRQAQLQALASRADATVDAKESLDLLNRNTLEAANISNQAIQTSAALEAARQAAELNHIARQQALSEAMKSGGAKPIRKLTY